jgi:hypothetical protein
VADNGRTYPVAVTIPVVVAKPIAVTIPVAVTVAIVVPEPVAIIIPVADVEASGAAIAIVTELTAYAVDLLDQAELLLGCSDAGGAAEVDCVSAAG